MRVHRYLLILALTACRSTAPTTPTNQASPATQIESGLLPAVQVRGEEVHHTLEARMREYKIPAVSIAVFDNYKLVWAKAYGLADVEAGTPADEHTTFLAGSISKSVNALAQLTAAADGLLSLDAPINDSLESWKLPDNELTRAKPVTLRMLLSHTAGTTVHGFRGYAPGEPVPTVHQILDGLPPANSAPIRVDLAPGTKFRYSGGGTTISQLALSERAKKPYPQILAERVLRPLEMTSSTFDQSLTPERLQHAAVGYDQDGKVVEGKRFVYPEMAAAGLWTTPSDLARFFLEIAKARAGTSQRISKTIAMQMTTKVTSVGDGPGDVGLGVFLQDKNGATYFGHQGADVGFQANAIASLDGGRGIAIMASSENGARIFDEIERTVMAAYGWPGASKPIVRVALDPALRAKLGGRYSLGGMPYEIVERSGKLIGRMPYADGSELVPIGPDVVVHRGDGAEIRATANDVQMTLRNGPVLPLARATDTHPLFLAEEGQLDAAVASLKQLPNARDEEVRINQLGYQIMPRDPAKAAELLGLNAAAFADSANAHDSYADALAKAGRSAEAIAEFERVLALVDADPRIVGAEKELFKKRATDEIAKLKRK